MLRRTRPLALPLAYIMLFLGAPDPWARSARADGPGPDSPVPPPLNVTIAVSPPTPAAGCPAGSYPPGTAITFTVTVVQTTSTLESLTYGITGPGYTQNPSGIGFSPNPTIGATIISKPVVWVAQSSPLSSPSTYTVTVTATPPAPAAPVTTTVTVTVCP